MNVISQQHQYGNNKELMKRLADASQYKMYPLIIPRNELSLRKILLTTRLWNHVRRQQAMMTIPSSDDWLFQQQSAITQENTKEQDNIPTNDNNQSEHDWSWFNKEAKSSSFLDSLSPEEDKSASRKRTKN
ncbi:uncharacterized protein B0P05DRAFT_522398, partial [Gilbertella persicaria]|uniref:uncharacterized protein n=1 Tax=Gilbertella persicaria TaxID=101096 RepID=UPI00221F5E66